MSEIRQIKITCYIYLICFLLLVIVLSEPLVLALTCLYPLIAQLKKTLKTYKCKKDVKRTKPIFIINYKLLLLKYDQCSIWRFYWVDSTVNMETSLWVEASGSLVFISTSHLRPNYWVIPSICSLFTRPAWGHSWKYLKNLTLAGSLFIAF